MLVDDYQLIIDGLKKSFNWEDEGYPIVAQALNGRQALEQLKTTPVDIIFTDIRMPVMDGLELIEILSEQYPHIKVAVLSAYDDFEQVRVAFLHGADDYLLKQEIDDVSIKNVLERFNCELKASVERETAAPPEFAELYESQNRHITQFKKYISNNYADSSLKIDDVAQSLGISVGHIGKLIFKETGCHFSDYLNIYRIERAKEMLASSTKKVYEIAYDTGYSNVEHFTRVFKKIVGVPPLSFANKSK